MVDGEKYPAMGYINEAMDRAKETIHENFRNRVDEYKRAFEIIDERWECQLHKPLHAAVHFFLAIFYDGGEVCEESRTRFI